MTCGSSRMILVAAAAWSMTAGCLSGPDPIALGAAEEDSSIESSGALRWPNTIEYLIDEDGQYAGKIGAHCAGDASIEGAAWEPLPAGDADAIRAGLAEYSEVTPIRFEEIHAGQEPSGPFLIYTRWKTSGASHASTGGFPSDGKAACVYLAHDKAIGVGTILHETGHELGTPHEQRRADARHFVIFDDRCVDSTQPWDPITTGLENLAPYDFDSIMEYSSNEGCDEALPGCDAGGGTCAHPPLVKNISGCVAGSTAAACQIGHAHDLSVSDVNVLYRAYERRLGSNEAGDHFASTLAVGDFDGDGFQDVAVGAYGEDVPGAPGGAVFLYKGTGAATAGTLGRLVAWRVLTPPGGFYHHFGEALAVGDFDGDGVDDLAVSAPGEIGGSELFGGALFVYSAIKLDRPDGTESRKLYLNQSQYWTELSLHTGLQSGDRFGAALAAGDFDGDGVDDLAVGIPHRTIGGVEGGSVQVLLGHKHGLLSVGQELTAASLAGEAVKSGARFGDAVLAQNFDPEIGPRADLIVGAPGSSSSTTGSAYVFRGTTAGTLSANAKLVPSGASEGGSRFGSSLAAGDFDGRTVSGKRIPYLVVGASEWSGGWGKLRIYRRADSGFTFAEAQVLDAPASIASSSAHYGHVLASARVDGAGNEALLVGVPDAGAGALVIYRHTSGSAPIQSSWVATGGASTGDDFGAAIAVGDFIGTAGAQNELVVGAPGASGGAGKLRVGDAQVSSGTVWQAWIDQESASPE
jgi:hypothetical protein